MSETGAEPAKTDPASLASKAEFHGDGQIRDNIPLISIREESSSENSLEEAELRSQVEDQYRSYLNPSIEIEDESEEAPSETHQNEDENKLGQKTEEKNGEKPPPRDLTEPVTRLSPERELVNDFSRDEEKEEEPTDGLPGEIKDGAYDGSMTLVSIESKTSSNGSPKFRSPPSEVNGNELPQVARVLPMNGRALRPHIQIDMSSVDVEHESKKPQVERKPFLRSYSRRTSIENFGVFGLLAPAVCIVPAADGKDALTQQYTDLNGEDRSLKLVAAHIDDAICGRGRFGRARAMFKPKIVRLCFKITGSKWWRYIVLLAALIHFFLIFGEPPYKDTADSMGFSATIPVYVLTPICLVVYILDVFFHIVFISWPSYWDSPENQWLRVEFVLICFYTVDFVMLVTQSILQMRLAQPFRCLRAAILLCKSKNVGHIFEVLMSIIIKLGKILFIILQFIVFFAAIGIHIFPTYYMNLTPGKNSTYEGAFNNIGIAGLRLFVLLSTENYPEFMIPAYSQSKASVLYFVVFLFIGVFILTAILLAIIVDSYWKFSKKHVKIERSRERQELAKAWNLLDPLGVGDLDINDPKLISLFRLIKPKNTDEMNQQLIEVLGQNGDGMINAYDWTTGLHDVLNIEFEAQREDTEETKARKFSHDIVSSEIFSRIILMLIVVHCVLFCVKWDGMSPNDELIVQGLRSSILVIFLLEVILRIVAVGKHLLHILEILDILLVVISIIPNIAWYFFDRVDMDKNLYRGICVVISSVAISLRLGFNSVQTKRIIGIFMKIGPVMFDLVVLVVIFMYFVSVIGWEIFINEAIVPNSSNNEAGHTEYDCGLGFNTFGCSLLINFQLVTTSNWHEIMNAAMDSTNGWAVLYFVTCYILMVLVTMNLFVAIAIEAFNKFSISENELTSGSNGAKQPDDENEEQENEDNKPLDKAKNFFNSIFESARAEEERERKQYDAANASLTVSNSPNSRRPSRISLADFKRLHNLQEGGLNGSKQNVKKEDSSSSSSDAELDTQGLSPQEKREKLIKRKQVKRRKKKAKSKREALEKEHQSPPQESVGTVKVNPAPIRKDSPPKAAWNGDLLTPDIALPTQPSPEVRVKKMTRFQDVAVAATAPPSNGTLNSTGGGLIMKKRETDWRRSILGEITIMNKEEMRELNKIMKSNFSRQTRGPKRGTSGIKRMESTVGENSIREEEESDPKLLQTAPPVLSQLAVNPGSTGLPPVEEESKRSSSPKKSEDSSGKHQEKATGGDMPSWMKQFVATNNLSVQQDLKIDESLPDASSEETQHPVLPPVRARVQLQDPEDFESHEV